MLTEAVQAAVTPNPDAPFTSEAEIIVTGERVARQLRDTPSSVAVFSKAQIEAAGNDRVDDLLSAIPNVQVGTGSEGPTIRGLDTTGPLQALPAFLGGNRPRTTLIVDGRAVTYNEFIFGTTPLWDVARVEVYRTPQTTTQGQNSIAGAIFVDTADPTLKPEYRARLIAGTRPGGQFSALASGPLAGDAVAFRVAGDLRYARTSSKIVDAIADADPNHDVYGLLRAKLLVTPPRMPGTRLVITYAHNYSQSPQIQGLARPFRSRRDWVGGYGVFRTRVDSITAQLHQQASAPLTIDAVLSVGKRDIRRLARPNFGQTTNNGTDWSGEAVANWKPSDALRLTGGFAYSHVGLSQYINLSLLSGIVGRFQDDQDSYGLFGQAELQLAPGTKIVGGARVQTDRQRREGTLSTNSGVIPLDYGRTFHAFLPRFSISHDFTPGLTAGVLAQKAYNPGGTTLRFDTGLPDSFSAEKLWDVEGFLRVGKPAGRLAGSVNLFNYWIRDAQRFEPITIPTPGGLPVGFANLFNVPRSRARGMEVELRWRPAGTFSATVGVGLLHTRVTRTDAESARFEDKEFNRSPHFSVTGSVDWKARRDLHFSAQLRRHSSYYSDGVNNPGNRVPASSIFDARAEYGAGSLKLFAQARNIFNALGLTSLGNSGLTATAEDSRELLVGIDRRF